MNYKDLKNIFHKIRFDNHNSDSISIIEEPVLSDENLEPDIISENEWNQEYELIYLSYILEK